MAGMLSNLPAFENCIMQKYGILSMLEKDSLSSSGSVADTEQFNKRLFKMICKFLYEECNAIFKEVFEDYSSDRSKEVARNNVRSLAGADHIEEVNKLSAKVYGEVEFFSFCNLLERIGIQKGEVLYDLGHGTGKAMVTFAKALLLYHLHAEHCICFRSPSSYFDTSLNLIRLLLHCYLVTN